MALTKTLRKFLLGAGLFALAATVSVASWAAEKMGIVVLNSNWCYSCREVVPIAQEVAQQNNLSVTVIDIDRQDAPRLARTYGIAIPSDRKDDAPWIYLVNGNRTVMIFSGNAYKPGYEDAARAQILQNLQNALGR